MKGLFVALAALAAFMVTVPAQAAVQEDVDTFVQLDKNQDGYVSSEEVKEQSAVHNDLPKFDSDSNGKLDLEEFATLRKEQAGATGTQEEKSKN